MPPLAKKANGFLYRLYWYVSKSIDILSMKKEPTRRVRRMTEQGSRAVVEAAVMDEDVLCTFTMVY